MGRQEKRIILIQPRESFIVNNDHWGKIITIIISMMNNISGISKKGTLNYKNKCNNLMRWSIAAIFRCRKFSTKIDSYPNKAAS